MGNDANKMSRVLQTTCLKPKYSLRRQLLVSFGIISVVAIGVVMVIATLIAKSSGENVKAQARTALKLQVTRNLAASSQVVAETVSKKFDNFGSVASIIAEGTRDRFVGYPDDFADDAHIPFRDMTTGAAAYPLSMPPLPAEWNMTGNVNVQNYEEHVQERFPFYSSEISTAHAHYFMQGLCDPSVTDPNARAYYPNCTIANSNFTTGGVVQPTSTNNFLAQKSACLAALLKPLYEYHGDVKILGMYFANSGAGSFVAYPSIVRNGRSSYTSIGCTWMNETNPLTGRPLGTAEEIGRCHESGATVPSREYNPLERSWCMDQALNPGKTRSVGPYLDAFSNELWLITFGRAVFDRMTGNFIGCTLLDVSISRIEEILDGVKIGGNSSDAGIALIRWHDGTVVSSSWNTTNNSETINIADLELGIDHEQIRAMVDFEKGWTPKQMNDTFVENVYEYEGRLVSLYPIPLPPKEFEATYSPDYIIVSSVGEGIFAVVDETDEAIDNDMDSLIRNTLLIGFAGIFVVLLFVLIFSTFLTRPLSWMERAARQIVNTAGDSNSVEVFEFIADEEPLLRCTPTTEITHLVTEFRTMIHVFSGEGAAKVARATANELKNTIAWQREFEHFYSSGTDDGTASSDEAQSTGPMAEEHSPTLKDPTCWQTPSKEIHTISPIRINMGSNITSATEDTARDEQSKFYFRALLDTHTNVFSSQLFWWIVVLIVIPLLLTMGAICSVVILDMSRVQPAWLDDVESSSMELEKEEIVTAATVKAHLAEEVMTEPIRDLHLLSRVAGWLFFGGLQRSDSFTDLDEGAEECKIFPPDGSCPFYLNSTRSPCDCSWEDSHRRVCQDYATDSRFLQRRFYVGQSQDADPVTGSRNFSSFPKTDFSPESTKWWDDVANMPGSIKGQAASGYETTYDRVRVLSAAAVVEFPIYNYRGGSTRSKHLGTYVGFEADGMMTGWDGCAYSYTKAPHFQSTEENGASAIREDLCPLGKYGFDCRCRDWYAQGRRKGLSNEGSGVHITPPYIFGSGTLVAASATAALIDPHTGTHVGQALTDFIPEAILRNGIRGTENYFEFVITPETDSYGGDTVIGPEYFLGNASLPIGKVVLAKDDDNSANRLAFENRVLTRMKAGETGKMDFIRRRDDGNEERVFIAFSPVQVRTSRPFDPSNYSRGVSVSSTLVFSLGVAVTEDNLTLPFTAIEHEVQKDIDVAATTLIVLIVVVSLLVTLFTYDVAVSITGPVIVLLGIVRSINAKRIRDDIPPMEGGSREANQVYNSFAKLHKVVRFSNTAFFSGNSKWAYKFLKDAMVLFRKLDDKKAIGIAANNLGNTLGAMCKESCSRHGCCIINNHCVWNVGRRCYDEAIQIGYDDHLNDPESCSTASVRADYTEQLANRHFNRGLFFLLTRNDPCAAEDAVQRGYEDLLKAKCLDKEANEIRLEIMTAQNYDCEYFEKLIRRLRGLVEILEDEGLRDVWGTKDLIDEAEHVLFMAWNTSSQMFKEISRIGRLQQLEDIAVQYELCMGNVSEAARIGMRMLVEDDFILESPFSSAANALLMTLRGVSQDSSCSPGEAWTATTVSTVTADLRNMARHCKTISLDTGKNVLLCLEFSLSCPSEGMRRATENVLRIYDECCSDYDNVGLIPLNKKPDDELKFPLKRKRDVRSDQRSMLIGAANAPLETEGSTSDGRQIHSALRHAVNLILDTGETDGSDTWIVVLTDGCSLECHQDCEFMSWISELNGKRDAAINIVIVGVELNDAEVNIFNELCKVSKASAFIDATGSPDSIDKAFEKVAKLLNVGSINGGFIYGGVTMEKF